MARPDAWRDTVKVGKTSGARAALHAARVGASRLLACFVKYVHGDSSINSTPGWVVNRAHLETR